MTDKVAQSTQTELSSMAPEPCLVAAADDSSLPEVDLLTTDLE
jgi:hypothetical protein